MKNSKIIGSTLCKVICVTPGMIGFNAPSFGYHIVFNRPGQQMQIKFELLQDAMHADNGYTLNNYLRVMDKEVREELGLEDSVEYGLSLKQIEKIILNGTVSELSDLLTYGPDGYSRFAADLAVKKRIDSKSKLEIIKKFSGTDVAFQIDNGIGVGTLDEKNEKIDIDKQRTYETVGVTSEEAKTESVKESGERKYDVEEDEEDIED